MSITAALVILAAKACANLGGGSKPEEVGFTNGSMVLHGYVYKPTGKGPWPVMIWNHGSEQNPPMQPALAKFYNDHGFVLFLPDRHGHGISPGAYIGDLQKQYDENHPKVSDRWEEAVKLQALYNSDVIAAIDYIRARSYVDRKHMYMSGVSYGGIQTLLTAEKGHGLIGALPFAPGAESWANITLQLRLSKAVLSAKIPMFLFQAKNDYNLGPSAMLGLNLAAKGKPNGNKVFPAYGAMSDHNSGHYLFAIKGTNVWGSTAWDFIKKVGT